MGCFSASIFEEDVGDLNLLCQAKKDQLRQEGVQAISDGLLDVNITKKELRHYYCRRTPKKKVERCGESGEACAYDQCPAYLMVTLLPPGGDHLCPALCHPHVPHRWHHVQMGPHPEGLWQN